MGETGKREKGEKGKKTKGILFAFSLFTPWLFSDFSPEYP
jgi:hypothetical protein